MGKRQFSETTRFWRRPAPRKAAGTLAALLLGGVLIRSPSFAPSHTGARRPASDADRPYPCMMPSLDSTLHTLLWKSVPAFDGSYRRFQEHLASWSVPEGTTSHRLWVEVPAGFRSMGYAVMLSKHLANGHPRDMTLWINLGQTASDTAGFADALFRKIVVAYGHDLPRPLQERYVGWQDDPAISALVSQGDLRALLDKTAGELRRAGFRPLLVLENAAGGPFENLLAQQTAFPDAWIGVRSSAVESPERTMSVFRVEPESVESVAQYLEQLSGSGVTFSPAAVAALRDASGGNPHIVPRILEELPGWVFECSDQHIARAVGRLRMRGEFQLPPYPRVEGGIDWANHIAPVKGEERIREWSVYSRRIHALLPPGVQLTEIGALHLHEQTGGDWALTVQILRTLPADFRRLDLVPLLPVLEEILNPYL